MYDIFSIPFSMQISQQIRLCYNLNYNSVKIKLNNEEGDIVILTPKKCTAFF